MWLARSTTCLVAALLLTAQTPRGWTMLFDVTGHCYYAVPPDWRVDDSSETANGLAISPGGTMTASIHWSPQSPWTRVTTELRTLPQAKQLHDDSEHRYWIEMSEPQQRTLHVAVVPSSSVGACTIEIEIVHDARDELRRTVPAIVGTLGSGR